tara:strand:- start:92 stop:388 length:297 start_codon:yes stop_codon:yes gene_type:complete
VGKVRRIVNLGVKVRVIALCLQAILQVRLPVGGSNQHSKVNRAKIVRQDSKAGEALQSLALAMPVATFLIRVQVLNLDFPAKSSLVIIMAIETFLLET